MDGQIGIIVNMLILSKYLILAQSLRLSGRTQVNHEWRNNAMKTLTKVSLLAAIVAVSAGCAGAPRTHAGCANPNYGAAVIGGLAGGVLGAQVGSGSGRTAATAIGAGTGAVIGSQMNCD
jgi:hypothetical protein